MTTCPEELLERSFETLDEEDKRALVAHVKTCRACALETGLAGSIDAVARESAGDSERVARAVKGALRRPVVRLPVRRRPRWVWIAAAAALVAAASAAAAISVAHRNTSVAPAATEIVPARHEEPTPARAPLARAPTLAASDSAIAIEDLPPLPSSTAIIAPPVPQTAAELFADANRKRQEGDLAHAIALYERLVQTFPTSNEALVAHVTLGRAYATQCDPAKALGEFDRYLADEGHKELREEALVGRARACSKLGRGDEEKRAWTALLREYPDSTYAAHARERVGAPP
jgi:TolA-binding protein